MLWTPTRLYWPPGPSGLPSRPPVTAAFHTLGVGTHPLAQHGLWASSPMICSRQAGSQAALGLGLRAMLLRMPVPHQYRK